MPPSIPSVPPGTNPWTVYLASARATLYHTPSEGFRGRLIVLMSLDGLLILLATFYLGILISEARQTKDGGLKGLWLFKLARRSSGAYLVCNVKLSCTLFAIIVGCVYSGFLLNQWNATLLGQAQNQSAAWQALQPIPILIQGWLVLWSSLQALLLATDHHENPLLSPRWANGLFVGLGSVLILAITAIAIPVVLQGQRLWSDFTSIQSRLTTLEAAWTPSDNVLPQLFELKPKLDALMVKGEFFRKLSISQIAVIAIMPFVFSTLNLAALRLAMLIRNQINFNLEQCLVTQQFTTSGALDSTSGATHSQVGSGGGAFVNSVASSLGTQKSAATEQRIMRKLQPRGSMPLLNHLTRDELRYLASRRGAGPETQERIRGVQALQRAERDLVIIAGILTFAMAAVAANLGILLYCLIHYTDPSLVPWALYETTQLGLVWMYMVLVPIIFVGLIASKYISRDIDFESPDTSRVVYTSNGNNYNLSPLPRSADSRPGLTRSRDTETSSAESTSPQIEWKSLRINVHVHTEAKLEKDERVDF